MRTMTVFSGLALKDLLEENFMAAFIENTGSEVYRVYEPTTVLFDLIRNGERPDVVIGVTSALDEMALDGYLQAPSVRGLVRSDVGVAVGPDMATNPLENVADLQELLEKASAVAYSATGASGKVFARVLSEMGLTDLVETKAVILPKGFTAEAVRDGRADVAIQQISELASVEGTNIVGPLPPELHAYVELSIGIGTESKSVDLAREFVSMLRNKSHEPVYSRAFLTQLA